MIGDPQRCAFVSVNRDKTNPDKAPPMCWWLSKHVHKHLYEQLDPEEYVDNARAFGIIDAARKQSAPMHGALMQGRFGGLFVCCRRNTHTRNCSPFMAGAG